MSLYGSIGIGPLRVGASTRGGRGGNVVGTLLVLAIGAPIYFAIRYWYVTLAIVGLAIVLTIIGFAVIEGEEWRSERARRKADIIHRADAQHAALVAGDEIYGTYGHYPPYD